jgi:hypothetical protein
MAAAGRVLQFSWLQCERQLFEGADFRNNDSAERHLKVRNGLVSRRSAELL